MPAVRVRAQAASTSSADIATTRWQTCRIRLVCDAYGALDDERRQGIVGVIPWWQARCRRGIEAGAEGGEPAMVRLRDGGASRPVRAAHDGVAAHRRRLSAALR